MTSASKGPAWLLLLPRPPFPLTLANIRFTCGQAIEESLQKASRTTKSASVTQVLDIAITYPGVSDESPRSTQYKGFQDLVCQFYRLLCIICAELSIDADNSNEVDARVMIFGAADSPPNTERTTLTLQSLASCQRPWKQLLATNDEAGKALLDRFVQSRGSSGQQLMYGLDIGLVSPSKALKDHEQGSKEENEGHPSQRHYSVAVGGTFDHLHAGHKLLLTMTALVLEPKSPTEPSKKRVMTIGITGDALLKKKQYAEVLEDWDQRQGSVREFLSAFLMLDSPDRALSTTNGSTNPESGARMVRDEFMSGLIINYVEIFDPFGPTTADEEISALVVSAETRSGGKAVNDRRSEKGWATLEVFEVTVLNAGDDNANGGPKLSEEGFQDKISSTDIRQKIHNRRSETSALR